MVNVRATHIMRVLAVGLLFLAGCAATRGGSSSKIYTAPKGNFTLPVPAMGLFGGTTVQDQADEEIGYVSFHGDLGKVKSITYLKLPSTWVDDFADLAIREAALRGFLHDYAMPVLFEPVSPVTEILAEDLLGAPAQSEYFAVVKIPEGSTLEDAKTGRRLESTRALLIFPRGEYMYMLSYASDLIFNKERSIDEFIVTSKAKLREFLATIKFTQAVQP